MPPAWSSRLGAALGGGLWRYYAGFGIGRLALLAVLPVVGRLLGPAGLGFFESALAVLLASAIVVDAGIGASLIRYLNDDKTGDWIRTACRLQVVVSCIAFVVFSPAIIAIRPPDTSAAVLVAALFLYVTIEGYAIIGAGVARARSEDTAYLVLSVGRFAVTAAAGTAGALIAGTAGALVGISVGGLPFVAYVLRIARQSHGRARRDLRRALLRYGLPLMATTVMTWTLSLSDRIFLRALRPATELGNYAANYRLGSGVIVFLSAPLAYAWIPIARACPPHELRALTMRWASLFTTGALLVAALATAAGGPLVQGLFGSQFHVDRTVIACVGVSGWVLGVYYFYATPVLLTADTRRLAAAAGLAAVVNLFLNAVLIDANGARGAAIATLVSYVALCMITAVAARPLTGSAGPLVDSGRLLVRSLAPVAAIAAAALSPPAGAAAAALLALAELWRRRSTLTPTPTG